MNFQTLTKVENAQAYLDIAHRQGEKAAERAKLSKKLKLSGLKRSRGRNAGESRFERIKQLEIARVNAIRNSLSGSLSTILKSFPNISSLPPFYYELVRTAIDYYQLKKSLGTMNWGRERVSLLHSQYLARIGKLTDFGRMQQVRREFVGRASSVFYQMDRAFTFLEQARRTMKGFPTIKTGTRTVVITGFPNVGKTTLLFKLTGSKPEISDYAFTTKRLNVSYFSFGREKIQVVDTPGTLNRFNKMNMIEKQAYLAMKYCADLFVYVFDLTEPYPIADQEKMYAIVKRFDRETIVYLSKADILGKEAVEGFARKHGAITEPGKLKEAIISGISKLPKQQKQPEEE
jgi:nucleolar GTP-binding protein